MNNLVAITRHMMSKPRRRARMKIKVTDDNGREYIFDVTRSGQVSSPSGGYPPSAQMTNEIAKALEDAAKHVSTWNLP